MTYTNNNGVKIADYGSAKPRQRIATSSKTKKWADDSAEYYLTACVEAVDRDQAIRNYKLANGELDESEYLYVTNPLNTKRPELMGYPAKLQNYDIISPTFALLMGEKGRRAFPPIVYARNSNHFKTMEEEEKKMLIQALQRRFINEAIKQGVPMEGEEAQGQIQEEMQAIAQKIRKLPDTLASMGQDVLEYIMDYNILPTKFRNGFLDWLTNACVYTYKDVYEGETCFEMISPIHMAYLCSENHTFIRHGEAVRASYWLNVNEIYDRFQNTKGFNDEVKQHLESVTSPGSSSTGLNLGYRYASTDVMEARRELFDNVFGKRPREDYASGMQVDHVMWRSMAEEGTLVQQDMFGNVNEIIVSDDYKPLPEDMITWKWKDEIWENYKIDDKFWLGATRVPIQNGKKPSLLYNGRNMFTRHTRPKSFAEKGRTYQKAVNIVKYRAENTLAKNLDKIVLFPLGLIPKKEGWDEDKLMYYVRAFSFLFFDETRPNAHLLIQAMRDLDMSSLQHVLQSYQLVQVFKQEWEETCGINPQRKGQISNSAGLGVTQQARDVSYIMSEELFLEYEEFEKDEYGEMLEISKFAFAEGKQTYFVRPDGTNAFLDLHDPESFLWCDFGVFVKNGAKEHAKLETLRGEVKTFVQNNVDPKMVSAIVEAENFAKLHEIMDEIDATAEARRQQQMQVEQEATASAERIKKEERDFDYYDSNLKSKTDIQVALITQGMKITQDMKQIEEKGDTKTEDYEALRGDLERNAIELMRNATDLKKIAADERNNIRDNKTKLKNKVSGEK